MVTQCCVCCKIRSGDRWEPVESLSPDARVTSTYCPPCAETALTDVRGAREQAKKRAAAPLQLSAG
jgi:hypothetical protein